jgi:hypothetical protein
LNYPLPSEAVPILPKERIQCSFPNCCYFPPMWKWKRCSSRPKSSRSCSPQLNRPDAAPAASSRLAGSTAGTYVRWLICRAKGFWCAFSSQSAGSGVMNPLVGALPLPNSSPVCAEGHYALTARLRAAAALREQTQTPPPPTEREAFEQIVATARAALDEPAFAREWTAGTTLTQDEAIDEALSAFKVPHRVIRIGS